MRIAPSPAWVPPRWADGPVCVVPRAPFTPSEREVLACVSRAMRYRAIAEWLGMAESTARRHVENAADKMPPFPPDRPMRNYWRAWIFTQTGR